MAAQAAEDVVAAEDFARLFGQQQQQFVLGAGQRQDLALAAHFAARHINLEAFKAQHFGLGRAGGGSHFDTAQHRGQAGRQLARLKRLGQVVVGPHLQAHHPVGQLASCGQHQHRGAVLAADLAQHFKTVHLRQHHIQDHGVKGLGGETGEAHAGAIGMAQLEVVTLQIGGQRWRQVFVVVDQQDAVHDKGIKQKSRP